ncbi:MAG: pentapeptide repeat-containing protein [Myxococcales bacterium]|nr:pentapeptide repeat-containing protein [Myxococcales bacterium]
MIDDAHGALVWDTLLAGRPLGALALPKVNGRLDLRGISAPSPSSVHNYESTGGQISALKGLLVFRNCRWNDADFTGASMPSFRFHDCVIENCIFDRATCSDWRMWGTTVSSCAFRQADLRGSALGGVDGAKRNAFLNIDFSGADLRRTVYMSAEMNGCMFASANIDNVNFEGTSFVNCVFQGRVRGVQFGRHSFRGESLPPNEMKNVDFRNASLRHTEFRGLDLEDVLWPTDEEHFVVDGFREVLDGLIGLWSARGDDAAKRLAAYFRVVRKWIGQSQRVGVVSRKDVVELGGEGAVDDFLRTVFERGALVKESECRREAFSRATSGTSG